MIFVNNNQNLSAASGIINMPFLEGLYHSFMSEALLDLGRQVVFHLRPLIEQDNTNTQNLPQAQQYNPYFGRVVAPNSNTRNSGTKNTPRDVAYSAHIKVGPTRSGDDTTGMGDLKANECTVTVVIEALEHVLEALSVSIEGRRYSIVETRPIGFTRRRYLMVKLQEIQEMENPSPDLTIG